MEGKDAQITPMREESLFLSVCVYTHDQHKTRTPELEVKRRNSRKGLMDLKRK
jgi:hypothetical protein